MAEAAKSERRRGRDVADRAFALCVACCRWPADAPTQALVRDAAVDVDWPLLLKLARRHRVEGLVWHNLRVAGVAMPDEVGEPLRRTAERNVRRNLLMAAECDALKLAFAEAGVPVLFVKGLALAMIAYGDLSTKRSWDIDLLIDPADVDRAAHLLEARGYALTMPAEGRLRLSAWHAVAKESTWNRPGDGICLDLHSALTDSPFELAGIDVHGPVQEVMIGAGRSLPTLGSDAQFAYLAAHGASSGWMRLKWIADFAALLAGADAPEIDRLYRRSLDFGAARPAGLGLLLADRLFGLPLSEGLRAEIGRDAVVRRLVARSLGLMRGRTAIAEVTDVRFGTLPIHRIQFAMRPGWRYKAGLARNKLRIRFF